MLCLLGALLVCEVGIINPHTRFKAEPGELGLEPDSNLSREAARKNPKKLTLHIILEIFCTENRGRNGHFWGSKFKKAFLVTLCYFTLSAENLLNFFCKASLFVMGGRGCFWIFLKIMCKKISNEFGNSEMS